MKAAPKVFEYLDVVLFLKDYYEFCKKQNSQFSYTTWAQDLGLKSQSFLRSVVIGKKKIPAALEASLTEKLFHSQPEKDYFYYLIRHSQAENAKDKQAFAAKMIQILKADSQEQLIENYAEFVATPILPRLQTLLSFQDIHPISKTFAKLLGISVSEVEGYLRKLENLGLASRQDVDGEIHWLSTAHNFKVPDQVGSESLLKYHKASLSDAIQALLAPKETRRYRSLLLPLTQEQLQEFYALLDAFSDQQASRFDSENYRGKKLFQANFNIHAVADEEK